MKNLQEKIQLMLDGEKKRRDVAIKWLKSVEELVFTVSYTLWGNVIDECDETTKTINLLDGEKKATKFYFCYHNRERSLEGFHIRNNDSMHYSEIKGKDFWNLVEIVIQWIEKLIELIDVKNESRNKLLEKINI